MNVPPAGGKLIPRVAGRNGYFAVANDPVPEGTREAEAMDATKQPAKAEAAAGAAGAGAADREDRERARARAYLDLWERHVSHTALHVLLAPGRPPG